MSNRDFTFQMYMYPCDGNNISFFLLQKICADAHYHLADMWVPDKSINDIWFDKKISEMVGYQM